MQSDMPGENPMKRARMSENVCTSLSAVESDTRDCIQQNVESCEDTLHNIGNPFAEQEALTNHLVLQNIFSHLDNNDVLSCAKVNELWHFVADPHCIKCFNVRLQRSQDYSGETTFSVSITKRLTYNNEKVTICSNEGLQEASKLLDSALETTEKVSIHLSTNTCDDFPISNRKRHEFLCKFGYLVEKLCLNDTVRVDRFAMLLAVYFPSLKHLDLADTCFTRSTEDRVVPMEDLVRIDNVSRLSNEDGALRTILRMASNLKEISDFPILAADDLNNQTACCVKSLSFPGYSPHLRFKQAMRRLSRFRLKLEKFSFEHPVPRGSGFGHSVRRILRSSRDSLKRLTLYKTESFKFQAIAPMNSLMEIEFVPMDQGRCSVHKCFPHDTILANVFPNVSTVTVHTEADMPERLSDILQCFPEDQFGQWGSQIERLQLVDVTVELLVELSKIFPSVTSLEFCVGDRCNELMYLLPAVGTCWPDVEYLTFTMKKKQTFEEYSLDSIFTGISDNALALFKHKLIGTSAKISSEEIQRLKLASTLRKFSRLKILKFQSDGRLETTFVEKLMAVTSVSREFGFQFLPELRLTLRANLDGQSQLVSEMTKSLKPIVYFRVEHL